MMADKLGVKIDNIKNCIHKVCKKLHIPISLNDNIPYNSVREFYNQLHNYALVVMIRLICSL